MGSVVNSLFLFLSLPLSVCLSLANLLTSANVRRKSKETPVCWKRYERKPHGMNTAVNLGVPQSRCSTLKLCLDAPKKNRFFSFESCLHTIWWYGSEYLSGWFEKQSAQGWIKYYTRTYFKEAGAISDGKRNHLFIYLFLKSRNLLCSPLASREC